MSSPFKTANFEKLKKKWYAKLEKSGFQDIEQDEDNLNEWEASIFSRHNTKTIAAKQEYFSLAGEFLHNHVFESKRHKKIWEMHCEGASLDGISKKLKSSNFKGSHRATIHMVIKKLAQEMMEKYGNPIRQKRPNLN